MQYSISNFPHQNQFRMGFFKPIRKKKHSGGMAELDEEAKRDHGHYLPPVHPGVDHHSFVSCQHA